MMATAVAATATIRPAAMMAATVKSICQTPMDFE